MDILVWQQVDAIRRRIKSQIDACTAKISSNNARDRTDALRVLRSIILNFNNKEATLFRLMHTGEHAELNVMDKILAVMRQKSSSMTPEENVAFLDIIEGICLLNYDMKRKFVNAAEMTFLLSYLDTKHPPQLVATIELLEAVIADCSHTTRTFESCSGVEKVSNILVSKRFPDHVLIKCVEFLSLYLSPESPNPIEPTNPSTVSSPSSQKRPIYSIDHFKTTEQKQTFLSKFVGERFVKKLLQTVQITPQTEDQTPSKKRLPISLPSTPATPNQKQTPIEKRTPHNRQPSSINTPIPKSQVSYIEDEWDLTSSTPPTPTPNREAIVLTSAKTIAKASASSADMTVPVVKVSAISSPMKTQQTDVRIIAPAADPITHIKTPEVVPFEGTPAKLVPRIGLGRRMPRGI
ncbi:hypothetical protein HDV05_002820 [Chytridiales sp. JEL 0842]|nr:hypothetical protein HDV05_002820 [Chytridiales sp. JEL 0842]